MSALQRLTRTKSIDQLTLEAADSTRGLRRALGPLNVRMDTWSEFAPNGWRGIQAGAAIVFFAYIGFDAVSTAAEETKNPKRDLPIGILGSLIICTVIYITVAGVFVGMFPLGELAGREGELLTVALSAVGEHGWATLVALGSVMAHTAVLLVFQLGQPRIFFSMARDGLLPKTFAAIHPRFRIPRMSPRSGPECWSESRLRLPGGVDRRPARHPVQHLLHGRAARADLGPLRSLARRGWGHLCGVWLPAEPARARRNARGGGGRRHGAG